MAHNVESIALEPVSSAQITLPELIKSSPSTWFIQIELLFRLDGIKDDHTKLKLLVRALPHFALESISNLLNNAGTTTYEEIKSALITKFSPNITEKLQLLSQSNDFNDLHPVELLKKLRAYLGGTISDELLRETFITRLPLHIQNAVNILAPETSIEALAVAAGRAMNRNHHRIVASTSTVEYIELQKNIKELSSKLTSMQQSLNEELKALNKRIMRLEDQARQRGRNRSQSRSSTLGPNRDLCWYHNKFGNDSYKCQEGCAKYNTFSGNSTASQ